TIGTAMLALMADSGNSSTVSVAGNSMGAEATGNNAASTISLNAVDLDFGPAGMGSADANLNSSGTYGYAVASGGATITNVQSNYETGEVSASLTDSAIGMQVSGDAISS